jgi:uncharacterized protein YbcI
MTRPTPDDPHTAAQELGDEMMRIHIEAYGKGAERAQVLMSEDAVIVFLDGIELQPSEEFLIESGHGDGVIEVRGRFQQAIETTFSAAVERVTGRRVVSFASVTKLDPNYVAEIFRLGERMDTGGGEDPRGADD